MAFGSSIIATLGLDTRDFREGVAQARSALGGFLSGAGGALVTTLISGAAIRSVIDYGDRIQDLSDRYNVNAESLQRLGNAAETNGSSLQSVAQAFNKLEISQARALAGSESHLKAFADLGVSIEDLRSLSPEQIMLKLGKSSGNAADMVAVLGKNATELRPTLEGLADGTVKFGAAINSLDVKRLSDAKDNLDRLGQSTTVAGGSYLGSIFSQFDAGTAAAKKFAAEVKSGNVAGAFNDLIKMSKAGVGMIAPLYGVHPDVSRAEEPPAKEKPKREAAETVTPPPSKEQLRAEQKERERLQFSLRDLAEGNPSTDVELRNNIQARYQTDQAREVQRLEEQAKREAFLYGAQDPTAGRATLDRADALRQNIGGLQESEKLVGAFKQAMDTSRLTENSDRMVVALED